MTDQPNERTEPAPVNESFQDTLHDSRRSPRKPFVLRRSLGIILFVLTCASTFFAGTMQFLAPITQVDPETGKQVVLVALDPTTGTKTPLIDWHKSIWNGLTYAIAVMTVLGAHEMGHYLQAVRYRVPQSLPLFIPMPFSPLGTMGAVIVQQSGMANRTAMFDIAITGPLAGLAIAIPLNWWGIQQSEIIQMPTNSTGWTNPLLVEWMVGWIKQPLKPGEDILLNPLLFAGWVGIFTTGLNLIPIGQLDGGHILYCLLGKKAHVVAQSLFVGAIGYVTFQAMTGHTESLGWTVMLLLLGFMGTRHPPTANDQVPLGTMRIVLGWLTLAFIYVSFVGSPLYQS